jgi:predicted ThiF/HesA family dinucleotide-utilizing enzyme
MPTGTATSWRVRERRGLERVEAVIVMSCRIDRRAIEKDLVVLCISGRITAQDVEMLHDILEQEVGALAIDLKDVLVVGREAVKLLALRESNGAELRNCPPYIREWVKRERADTTSSEEGLEGREDI